MQDELVKKETQSAKQLVLGFDAGCFTCSDLATRIEERVGDRLAVRNLNDPELQGWREQALVEDAKWAPTLFEVEGDQVKAWTGWKMGWALSRVIGPTATWQVMQALGEVGAAPRIEGSAVVEKLPEKAADAVVGMSRGRFLKGVSGAAVAMSVLSGTDLLAPPAEAAKRKKHPYDVVGRRRITGGELGRVARQLGSSVDVKNLVENRLSTPARVKAAKPVGFLNKLRNGSAQRVLVYRMSRGTTLSYVQFSKPPKGENTSRAFLLKHDARRKRSFITKASEGGKLWRVDRDMQSRTDGSSRALEDCPPIGPRPGTSAFWEKRRVCCDWAEGDVCKSAYIGTGSACGSCYLSLYAAYTVVGAAAAVFTCGGCLAGRVGTPACCKEYAWVWVYQYPQQAGP